MPSKKSLKQYENSKNVTGTINIDINKFWEVLCDVSTDVSKLNAKVIKSYREKLTR